MGEKKSDYQSYSDSIEFMDEKKIKKYKNYTCMNASLGTTWLCIGTSISYPLNIMYYLAAAAWYVAAGISYHLFKKEEKKKIKKSD